jgi:hypothetical protein
LHISFNRDRQIAGVIIVYLIRDRFISILRLMLVGKYYPSFLIIFVPNFAHPTGLRGYLPTNPYPLSPIPYRSIDVKQVTDL